MNMLKYIKYVLLLISTYFFLGASCTDQEGAFLWDGDYCVKITGISFGGDWEQYQKAGINKLYISADSDPSVEGHPIAFTRDIEYGNGKYPYVTNHNSEDLYIIRGNKGFAATTYTYFKVDSTFAKEGVNNPKDQKKVDAKYALNNMSYNYINLRYSTQGESALDLDINLENSEWWEKKWFWVSDAYRYDVDYKIIHGSRNFNKVNIVVMAEGYRADQIDQYRSYVDDAFKDTKSFHYDDVTNDFFEENWDNINIIRMDTISPKEGVDDVWYHDYVQSILNLNKDKLSLLKGGDFYRIRSVLHHTIPNLKTYDIDAIVILVNDPTIWCYSWSYDYEIDYRKGQPVHTVIIQAPVYKDNGTRFNVDDSDFHSYVKTDAIAHELGHAMGRLKDEYETPKDNPPGYAIWFRNICEDDWLSTFGQQPKWEAFINHYGEHTGLKEHYVGTFQGGYYDSGKYYRPTFNSTMNGHTEYNSDDKITVYPQFGPVNTYIMQATFHARLGNIEPYELVCNDYSSSFSWPNYDIDKFKQQWPVEKFR